MGEPPKRPEEEAPDAARARDEEHLRRLRARRQARVVKAVLILAIIVLLIVFVTQNMREVPIDFVFVTASFPLIWVLIVTAVLGGVVGYLLGRPTKETKPDDG